MIVEEAVLALTMFSQQLCANINFACAAVGQLQGFDEEQVGLLMDILKSIPDPDKHPPFLKHRRSGCRVDTLSDFSRPVESAAEHALFMECHLLHTHPKSERTDWRRVAREFNLRVTRSWLAAPPPAVDLWLKSELHLKKYEKQLVMQASLVEMRQQSAAMSGLHTAAGMFQAPGPAAVQGPGQGQVNLQPPGPAAAPILTAKAPGKGGLGRPKTCNACKKRGFANVTKSGHDCGLFLFLKGWTREKLVQKGVDVSKVPSTQEQAEALQSKKNAAALKDRKRKHPGQY